MADYVERVTEIYSALKEAGDVDQSDVAELAVAVLAEEAKDYRMEFIDERKDARVQQMRIGDESSESQEAKSDWRNDPATDAQKKALENLGVDFNPDLTKGEASNLIDQAKSQQQAEA